MKKQNIISLRVALWIITAISIVANFNNFLMGTPSESDVIVTVAFVAVWIISMLFDKGLKSMIFMTIWSGITLMTSIAGIFISLLRLDSIFIAPLALIFMTPYNGLTFIALRRWTEIYSVIIFISGSLTVWGLNNILKNKH